MEEGISKRGNGIQVTNEILRYIPIVYFGWYHFSAMLKVDMIEIWLQFLHK